jgi:signal transduction histidine kinase
VATILQPERLFTPTYRSSLSARLLNLVRLLLLADVAIGITTIALAGRHGPAIGPYQLAIGLYAAGMMALATTGWASARAVRAAHQAERARLARLVHDTALQSLEAMSVGCAADTVTPATTLAELRASARTEAAQLRRALLSGTRELGGLAGGFAEVVDEASARGLRVQLVAADVSSARVIQPRREALYGATRAALNNVLRHAGVPEAVVRVELADRGVRVIVRDHGRGFAACDARFGYGIQESIRARLREAGGRAEVRAAPGHGTRVTLWVPA